MGFQVTDRFLYKKHTLMPFLTLQEMMTRLLEIVSLANLCMDALCWPFRCLLGDREVFTEQDRNMILISTQIKQVFCAEILLILCGNDLITYIILTRLNFLCGNYQFRSSPFINLHEM